MKYVKGFHWGRKTKYKAAKEALLHAWTYAFRDRKAKKRDFREFSLILFSDEGWTLGTAHRLLEQEALMEQSRQCETNQKEITWLGQ